MSSSSPVVPTVEAVPYLARRVVGWFLLHSFRHGGVGAAGEALSSAGGCGRDEDGVWRAWDTINTGRGRIALREGSMTAPARVVRLAEVLAWAAARFDDADWARLDEHVAARNPAIHTATGDRDLWHRRTYRPATLTAADRDQIAAGARAQRVSERAAHDLVTARLTDTAPVTGEQLSLFTGPDPT